MEDERLSAAAILDDIAMSPLSAVSAANPILWQTIGRRIGTVVEYEYFRRYSRTQLPSLSSRASSTIVERISSLLNDLSLNTNGLYLGATEFDAMGIPSNGGVEWTAFLKRAEMTARSLGLADTVSAGLVGAIGELADNVLQHSESPESGVVAFAQLPQGFEYVVADAGIGILRSLRSAPELRSLRDDLEALPLALMPGVSRRGRDIGFGYGFRSVFLPLRAAEGIVRVRSGTAVLQIDGTNPRHDQGRCAQRPDHRGVVISVKITSP